MFNRFMSLSGRTPSFPDQKGHSQWERLRIRDHRDRVLEKFFNTPYLVPEDERSASETEKPESPYNMDRMLNGDPVPSKEWLFEAAEKYLPQQHLVNLDAGRFNIIKVTSGQAKMTSFSAFSSFYLVFKGLDDVLKNLNRAMNKYYNKADHLRPLRKPPVGTACAVKQDYKWLRCRVSLYSSSMCVEHVDSGNHFKVEPGSVMPLINMFTMVPPLALHCFSHALTTMPPKWRKLTFQNRARKFLTCIKYKLFATVLGFDKEGMFAVELSHPRAPSFEFSFIDRDPVRDRNIGPVEVGEFHNWIDDEIALMPRPSKKKRSGSPLSEGEIDDHESESEIEDDESEESCHW